MQSNRSVTIEEHLQALFRKGLSKEKLPKSVVMEYYFDLRERFQLENKYLAEILHRVINKHLNEEKQDDTSMDYTLAIFNRFQINASDHVAKEIQPLSDPTFFTHAVFGTIMSYAHDGEHEKIAPLMSQSQKDIISRLHQDSNWLLKSNLIKQIEKADQLLNAINKEFSSYVGILNSNDAELRWSSRGALLFGLLALCIMCLETVGYLKSNNIAFLCVALGATVATSALFKKSFQSEKQYPTQSDRSDHLKVLTAEYFKACPHVPKYSWSEDIFSLTTSAKETKKKCEKLLECLMPSPPKINASAVHGLFHSNKNLDDESKILDLKKINHIDDDHEDFFLKHKK